MVATTGAVRLEAGIAVGLTGTARCEVLVTAGVAASVREVTGLAAWLGDVAVTVGDAWPSKGAAD